MRDIVIGEACCSPGRPCSNCPEIDSDLMSCPCSMPSTNAALRSCGLMWWTWILGGMTLAVPGATGFVAPAQRAVIGMSGSSGRPCSGTRYRDDENHVWARSARPPHVPVERSIYGDTVTWRNSRPWALSTLRGPGRAITNRPARRAQPAKAPRVGEQLQPRPLLWLVRTHCGLGRICGSRRILNRRDHGRDGLRKPRAGLLGFEAMTCGFEIRDSPFTRHAHRGNSGGNDADRKPVSSANVHAKTPGGPRRARTDDLRIKRTADTRSECWRSAVSCVVR